MKKSKINIAALSVIIIASIVVVLALIIRSLPNDEYIPDYKGVVFPYSLIEVTDDELPFVTALELSSKGIYLEKEFDSAVENADFVNIDVCISCQSLTSTKHFDYYQIDSETNEFDNSLLGAKKGQSLTFSASCPENLADEDFANKDCEFNVIINSIYTSATEMTDDIASTYYNCETKDEAMQILIHDVENNRIWSYIYDDLLNDSQLIVNEIDMNNYIDKLVNNHIQNSDEMTDSELEEYIIELEDVYSQLYYEIALFDKIALQEGLSYSSEEMNAYLTDLASENNIAASEILNEYGEEYICYLMEYDDIMSIAINSAVIDRDN